MPLDLQKVQKFISDPGFTSLSENPGQQVEVFRQFVLSEEPEARGLGEPEQLSLAKSIIDEQTPSGLRRAAEYIPLVGSGLESARTGEVRPFTKAIFGEPESGFGRFLVETTRELGETLALAPLSGPVGSTLLKAGAGTLGKAAYNTAVRGAVYGFSDGAFGSLVQSAESYYARGQGLSITQLLLNPLAGAVLGAALGPLVLHKMNPTHVEGAAQAIRNSPELQRVAQESSDLVRAYSKTTGLEVDQAFDVITRAVDPAGPHLSTPEFSALKETLRSNPKLLDSELTVSALASEGPSRLKPVDLNPQAVARGRALADDLLDQSGIRFERTANPRRVQEPRLRADIADLDQPARRAPTEIVVQHTNGRRESVVDPSSEDMSSLIAQHNRGNLRIEGVRGQDSERTLATLNRGILPQEAPGTGPSPTFQQQRLFGDLETQRVLPGADETFRSANAPDSSNIATDRPIGLNTTPPPSDPGQGNLFGRETSPPPGAPEQLSFADVPDQGPLLRPEYRELALQSPKEAEVFRLQRELLKSDIDDVVTAVLHNLPEPLASGIPRSIRKPLEDSAISRIAESKGGKVFSKDLQRELGFSQEKASQMIKDYQQAGIIQEDGTFRLDAGRQQEDVAGELLSLGNLLQGQRPTTLGDLVQLTERVGALYKDSAGTTYSPTVAGKMKPVEAFQEELQRRLNPKTIRNAESLGNLADKELRGNLSPTERSAKAEMDIQADLELNGTESPGPRGATTGDQLGGCN